MKTIPVTPPSKWPSRLRTAHKWLTLIIGIQLVLWMLSGLYMSSIDISLIHGDHLTSKATSPIEYQKVKPLPNHYQQLQHVSLTTQNDMPVYIIQGDDYDVAINATTGEEITIDQHYIQRRARQLYSQQGSINQVKLLTTYPSEIGAKQQPVWQVSHDDRLNSTLYFSANTGELVKARSDLWRLFDLMWVLHIMDYEAGEDVNNLLLSVASVLALLAACSGVWLIFYSISAKKANVSRFPTLVAIHKWLAMIVGVQVLLWLLGGLLFNLLSQDKVNLNYQLKPQKSAVFAPHQINIAQLSDLYPAADKITINATPIAPLITIIEQARVVYYQLNGQSAQPIDKSQARDIALQAYSTQANISHLHKILPGHVESRKLNRTLWQVNYQDEQSTALYIDAYTGRALTLKDNNWRLKDWFWMLHIMDYSQRSDFNTPWLITFATLASFVSLSGFLMLFWAFSRRDFGLSVKPKQHKVTLTVEQHPPAEHIVTGGQPLISALRECGVELPSGCGGSGTCCQCMVTPQALNQPLTSQERNSLSIAEINQGRRLACQIQVDSDLAVTQTIASQPQVTATVISSTFKTPFIKEIVLRLPLGQHFSFRAGQYVNVEIPTYQYTVPQALVPINYKQHWLSRHLVGQSVRNLQVSSRSYSIANSALALGTITFNVKLALPTQGHGLGIASTYLCQLTSGQSVNLTGPYGEFVTDAFSHKELVLIGAGAGMAPLKSHIDTLLAERSPRKLSLWFGARTQDDIYYQAHFDKLAKQHANFSWHISLSKPQGTNWQGNIGHIQQALFNQYLSSHPNLHNIEFLLCGPSNMMREVKLKLQRLGVSNDSIKCDDFG